MKLTELSSAEAAAQLEIAGAGDAAALEALRVKYLGRKGLLPAWMEDLKNVPREEKPAFGKRINERLTLVYEQGLTVANNALRIEYALTRSLTVRAEAGIISSLGLYFRRSYD